MVSRLRDIFSPNSEDLDAVGGKLEVYEKTAGELEFKCYPEISVDVLKADIGVNVNTGALNLKTVINKILNEYVDAKKETFAGHPMGSFFRTDIPLAIYGTGIVESTPYLITGSVGQGNWAMVPWVCIFDRKITTTATKGIYIVYLLSKDGKTLYISFNQGCTDIRKTHSKKETIKIMHQKAEKIRAQINSRGFNADNKAKLGDSLTELGELYQEGMIFYKAYQKGNVPEESELTDDLKKMMEIYKDYVEGNDADEWMPATDVYDPQISKETWLELLSNKEVFQERHLLAMACMYDNGGEGSCTGLAEKYHQNMTLWRTTCGVHLAEKIADATRCPRLQEDGKTTFFVIPFLYRKTSSEEQGSYIYKLRPELYEALTEFNIMDYLVMEEGEEELSIKETLKQIKKYIESEGFSYDSNLIENFYLSLKAKPFVLLAGTSGTGKTRLARLFAKAIGAFDDDRYLQVAVKPDWSDSTDLFGHVNLENEFVPGAIIEFIKKAADDIDNRPYILCLDEMNLARVEYYFSDFLSVIETRDWSGDFIKTDRLVPKVCYSGNEDAAKLYQDLTLPENLYIIGTVNMDETTFPFSKKVLDRANTIEFSYVDFELADLVENEDVAPVLVDNSFLRADFLRLKKDCKDQWETVQKYNEKLIEINKILKDNGDLHFGYRMRDEIIFYMLYREKADLFTENEAFDNQIMQKILPRIQGSSEAIADLLKALFKECAGPFVNKSGSSDSHKMENYMKEGGNAAYPKSADKIWKMLRRFEDDDFTSYWV